MPGFDRTGPMGMGAMTGGARGLCNSGRARQTGSAVRGYGGGRGRGHSNMYWATGQPGWQRSDPSDVPAQELSLMKNKAEALKTELDAINARLQEIERRSEG